MSKIKEKLRAVASAVQAIEKQFGKGAIMPLGGPVITDIAVVSTGSLSLDLALGVGGLPRGRVVEIFGPESSGKTTLTLHTIAEAQRAGGVCAFIDAEHALDSSYARRLGVNLDELLVSQPDCGEQALEIADTLVRTGAIDLVVIDSVAALTPRAEIEGEMGDAHMGLQARLMSQALRKLTAATSRHQTCVVFINQNRPRGQVRVSRVVAANCIGARKNKASGDFSPPWWGSGTCLHRKCPPPGAGTPSGRKGGRRGLSTGFTPRASRPGASPY